MIPPDVASSLRPLLADPQAQATAQTAPVPPSQRIADILGNLVPGQRIMAEIQALLPNGTYRAVVAQRDITLALPFTAKAGDSIELEVVDSDGKLGLSAVANRSAAPQGGSGEAVASTLSQTGRLISDLLGDIDGEGRRAPPAPLNGNQPLVGTMPENAADLAPVLRQALSESGMFYEAHQARWVAGELPTARLLAEPQGRYSQPVAPPPDLPEGSAETPAPAAPNPPPASHPAHAAYAAAAQLAEPPPAAEPRPETANRPQSAAPSGLPADLQPIVQQQLDALATQTFAWQGQVWPGQQMHWEIEERQGERRTDGSGEGRQWTTRLRLQLPQLGGIEATLSLRPGLGIEIGVQAADNTGEARLNAHAGELQQQFAAAGLALARLQIAHGETAG